MPQQWSVVGPARCEPGMQEAGGGLSDEMLLQICRASVQDADARPEWMANLWAVPLLVSPDGDADTEPELELALTLLAWALGELPRHHPTRLPYGFGGPRHHSHHWIEHETLDRIGKQIVGLIWHDREPETVACAVECAVADAVRFGFIEQRQYDAWAPGMQSGSAMRTVVMPTPYGMAKAQHVRAARAAQIDACAGTEAKGSDDRAHPDETDADVMPREAEPSSAAPQPVPAKRPHVSEAESSPQPAQHVRIHDRYAWARQIDLLNATNQVLGDGTINKGALSRACRAKRIETNGKTGRASRVSVPSFLAWLTRQCSLAGDEQIQVRNAIIGEINARNL